MDPKLLGKILLFAGLSAAVVGAVFIFFPKAFSWFGKLPGDISVLKKNFSFYFPIATCLLISAVLSVIFWIVGRK